MRERWRPLPLSGKPGIWTPTCLRRERRWLSKDPSPEREVEPQRGRGIWGGKPDFPGGSRLERPKSGLAMYMKEQFPMGAKQLYPPNLKVQPEERNLEGVGQSPMILASEDSSGPLGENRRIPVTLEAGAVGRWDPLPLNGNQSRP